MYPRVRTRNESPVILKGTSEIYWPHSGKYNGELISKSTDFTALQGGQITSDFVHHWPPRGAAKNLDMGGGFLSQRWKFLTQGNNVQIVRPEVGLTGRRVYSGFWLPLHPWVMGPLPPPSMSLLNALGTRGIAESAPTAPEVSVTRSLAELRQLPKFPVLDLYKSIKAGTSIRDLVRRTRKGMGNEYLNTTFGWMPLEKDMKDFHKATKNASKIIKQFQRDSGKVVRRRRTLLDETETKETVGSKNNLGIGPGGTYLSPGSGTTTTIETRTRAWFEGAFIYYLHMGTKPLDVARRNEQVLNRLYGTRFGVDTLYALTPWSWALDWVSNVGDIVTNMQQFSNDNLVLKYGYVMHNRRVTTSARLSCVTKGGTAMHTSLISVNETKMRIQANPYGFGSEFSDLSPYQLGVIAALGLSRS